MALPQERIDTNQQTSGERPELTREYVVSFGAWSSRIGHVLSNFVDDLESIVGSDVYERMSRDPVVSKNLQYQKLSVVSEGVQLHPACSDEKDPDFAKAAEIKEFHQRSLEGLHRPIGQIVGELMVALKRAHAVAEVTYKDPVPNGRDPHKLLLRSIKVKPRNSTAFVIDAYRNVIGLTAWLYGNAGIVNSETATGQNAKVIPVEKFAVLAFDTEDEDPRGVNPLRPAYNFWQAKCLVPGLHLKWLEKSGIPSTVGFTAPNAGHEMDIDGTDKTPQEAMADTLTSLESGSSAAFPFGALVEKIEVSGTGIQFTKGYQDFDQQIDFALSLQSGATKDSKTGSYSSKLTLKDVLDILIWSRKHAVAQVFQGILKNSTRYNFGVKFVHLTPTVMIGDEEGRDFSKDAHAVVALGPTLTDSQYLKLLMEIGIAAPDKGEKLPPRGVPKALQPGESEGNGKQPVKSKDDPSRPAQPGRQQQGSEQK